MQSLVNTHQNVHVPKGSVLNIFTDSGGVARANLVTSGVSGGPYTASNGTSVVAGPFSKTVDIVVEAAGEIALEVTAPESGGGGGTGGVVYQGTWNATSNTPTLASGVGTLGYLYKVATAGTTAIDGISQWNVGDEIVFDGTVWDKIDGLSSEVVSVAGRTGAITLAVADVSGAAPSASPTLTTPSVNSPITKLAKPANNNASVSASIISGYNAGATIALWQPVYMASGGTWLLADADGSGTRQCRGLAAAAGTSGNPMDVMDTGIARNDSWTWTPGGDVYLTTTAGVLSQTPPASGADVRRVGYALSATEIYVKADSFYVTV